MKHYFFLLEYYLWCKFQQDWTIFGGVRAQTPPPSPKWPNSWMLHHHENIWKFINWQPQMLQRWNLSRLCIFMRPFIWKKIRASSIGRERAWPKKLWKKAKNSVFWLNFLEFSRLYQKLYHMSCITLHCITGKNFVQIRLDLGL